MSRLLLILASIKPKQAHLTTQPRKFGKERNMNVIVIYGP